MQCIIMRSNWLDLLGLHQHPAIYLNYRVGNGLLSCVIFRTKAWMPIGQYQGADMLCLGSDARYSVNCYHDCKSSQETHLYDKTPSLRSPTAVRMQRSVPNCIVLTGRVAFVRGCYSKNHCKASCLYAWCCAQVMGCKPAPLAAVTCCA